ncbi:MAG: FkbM family methyltransferase [Variovorax sp.]|nr:MAG: FkbM family methyltransferase [Variovorax sp.]
MNFIRQCEGRHGRFFYNVNDAYVGRSMRLYGEWAEAEVHLLGQIVQPGDVVLEAGANMGAHTVALSRLAGPGGQVHAFEPQGPTHQLLCANLVVNGCVNTRTYQSALGAASGWIEMGEPDPQQPNNFGGASLHVASGRMQSAPMQTIDSLSLQRLDLLKADIEGYEFEMLQGAGDTLDRCRPVVFIESVNPYTGDCSEALKDYFVRRGYRCWHYITPMFNAQNFDAYPHDEFKGLWSFDMLCVPPERGSVSGLDDAQLHSAVCELPEQWRSARFDRQSKTD